MNAIDMLRPVPGLDVRRPAALGRIFYVDEYGARTSESNEGTDPDFPLTKIETAIGKCVGDNGDYVMVLDCYNADTFTITVDKAGIHILGLALPNNWGWAVLDGGGTDVFTVTANYVEIAGFGMISASATAIALASGNFFHIHHCKFAQGASALQHGIEATSGTPSEGLIEDCDFGKLLTSITGNGITGALTSCMIRRNTFRQIAGNCIDINIANIGQILDNRFANLISDTPSDGWAIMLGAGSSGGIIDGNRASTAGSATGNNPYRDQSSGATATMKNAWAANYKGEGLVTPATS